MSDSSIDDEPDEWDVRINDTGCSDQNMKLTDCYAEKRDWRLCTAEMKAFKECWQKNENDKRVATENFHDGDNPDKRSLTKGYDH